MRVLFANHGAIGTMLGHLRVEDSLRVGLPAQPDVTARFVRMPAWNIPARLLARPIPLLDRADLDLHTLRWHLVEASRARKVILRQLSRFQPDVLHLHSHTLGLLLGDVMRRIPTLLSVDATVQQWHDMGIWRDASSQRSAFLEPSLRLEREAFRRAAAVVPWSDWAGRGVASAAPEARITPIHPGIDVGRFRPRAKRIEGPGRRVLFVGGRFAEKGGLDLIEALADELRSGEVRLDVVTRDDVPVTDGVHRHQLLPNAPELAELHRDADVSCLPTRGDSYPWAVTEALASGVPVVATSVGAIPELVADGEHGFLVRRDDPRDLRSALLRVLREPELRHRLGCRSTRARARALRRAVVDVRLAGVMRSAITTPGP
jgi:glycosyltransferase involved in cell wall biosynthesis